MVIQWDINGDNVNKTIRNQPYFHYTIPKHDKIGVLTYGLDKEITTPEIQAPQMTGWWSVSWEWWIIVV